MSVCEGEIKFFLNSDFPQSDKAGTEQIKGPISGKGILTCPFLQHRENEFRWPEIYN